MTWVGDDAFMDSSQGFTRAPVSSFLRERTGFLGLRVADLEWKLMAPANGELDTAAERVAMLRPDLANDDVS